MSNTAIDGGSGPGQDGGFWKAWEQSLGPEGLISYRYLGCNSVALDRHHAEGRMRIRHDMRGTGGLLVAPLGIALLDTAGINVDAIATVAPTRIDLDILEAAFDVEEVRIAGQIVREGRSQMFTDARIEDARQPGRVIAYGATSWAVVAPVPPGYRYVSPGPGAPESDRMPPLATVFGGESVPAGGFSLAGLSPRIGARMLHQGPIQVLLEAAAGEVARAEAGSDRIRIEHSGVTIVQRGTVGPFVTSAGVVSSSAGVIAVAASLRDEVRGHDVATAFTRWSRIDNS
jgi:acyl-coenzyme A thioesterase PaaI-like protein